MGLGRQVEDRARPMLLDDRLHQRPVRNIPLDEGDTWLFRPGFDAVGIGGIRDLVDDHDGVAGVAQRVLDEIGPDEPGPAGDEQTGHLI